MPGIQTPFVYVGSPGTSFGFHLEDGNLASVNYLHQGKPKVWYFVRFEDNKKLETLSAKISKNMGCDKYIRHKTLLIPPSVLVRHKIKFCRVSFNRLDFSILFFHFIFSILFFKGHSKSWRIYCLAPWWLPFRVYMGLNIAEAVNFGTDRWLHLFGKFTTCSCE